MQPQGTTPRTLPLVLRDPSSLPPPALMQRRKILATAHRSAGVEPKHLVLPFGHRLWFVHVVLDLEVHAGCLGFTRHLHEYASGASDEEAVTAVRAYLAVKAPDAHVVSAEARPSLTEHPKDLMFPEQVRRLDMLATPASEVTNP